MKFSHWTTLPMHIDQSPYADYYQGITKEIASKNQQNKTQTSIVEAGVRYGCSARFFIDALDEFQDWKLDLIDPRVEKEALELTADNRVTFQREKAEAIASKFAEASIDLLHVDVDPHTYDVALTILLAYWSKLKPEGEVIFHDCTSEFPEIEKLVEELGHSKQWNVSYCPPAPECPIAAPAHTKRIQVKDTALDLTVVVPVYKKDYLEPLLNNIKDNTVQPKEVIVIDNGKGLAEEICASFQKLPIKYLKQKKNIGVNASWNLGLKTAKTELISILNDDLVLPECFFSLIKKTFRQMPLAGFVVPSTVGNQRKVLSHDSGPSVGLLPTREGWAFTLRKSVLDPIPSSMFTFFGDDWFFQQIATKRFWALKILNNYIYHQVGISGNLDERKVLGLPSVDEDRKAWNDLQKQN